VEFDWLLTFYIAISAETETGNSAPRAVLNLQCYWYILQAPDFILGRDPDLPKFLFGFNTAPQENRVEFGHDSFLPHPL
jgi:hypothetical protein